MWGVKDLMFQTLVHAGGSASSNHGISLSNITNGIYCAHPFLLQAPELGVVDVQVSLTPLEEVFLNVARRAEQGGQRKHGAS